MNEDLTSMTYEKLKEVQNYGEDPEDIYIELTYKKPDSDLGSDTMTYILSKDEKRTRDFLKQKGYIK